MESSDDASLTEGSQNDIVSAATLFQVDHDKRLPVIRVPIRSLSFSDSPRLSGEHMEHVYMLAQSDTTLPPIIVNRATMRVIDGMHRLRAATLRGQSDIDVQFFDGNEGDSFVLAVRANIAHGLPLSLTDRTTAAARIISSHPQWSDRLIASATGLAARTVGAIRRRSTGNTQSNARIGRDGRVRPLDAAEGRRIASELMASQPDASLREIASAAGISLGTAQKVREQLRRCESPAPLERHDGNRRKNRLKHDKPAARSNGPPAAGRALAGNRVLVLNNLRKDPSLRFSDTGRVLLRLLHVLAIDTVEWETLIGSVPAHCIPMVSNAARACADVWQEFAKQLERH